MHLRHRVTALAVVLLSLAAPILAQQPAAREPGALRGVLLDAEGLPAEGYQIGARSAAGDLFLSPRTGADGAFALTGLPSGTYQIVAFAPDGSEFPLSSGTIAIAPGTVERLELRITGKGGPPGRAAADVQKVREASRAGGGFWKTRAGRLVMIGGGVLAAALLYDAIDDDETAAVSPAAP